METDYEFEGRTEVNFRWSEVKEKYLEFVATEKGGSWKEKWVSQRALTSIRDSEWKGRADWVGSTIEEMKTYIKDGYRPPELAKIDAYTPKVRRRKQFSDEEGDELQFDRAW